MKNSFFRCAVCRRHTCFIPAFVDDYIRALASNSPWFPYWQQYLGRNTCWARYRQSRRLKMLSQSATWSSGDWRARRRGTWITNSFREINVSDPIESFLSSSSSFASSEWGRDLSHEAWVVRPHNWYICLIFDQVFYLPPFRTSRWYHGHNKCSGRYHHIQHIKKW